MITSYVIQVVDATKPLFFIGPEEVASGKSDGAVEPTPLAISLRAVDNPLSAERFDDRGRAEDQAERYAVDVPDLKFVVLEIIEPPGRP